MKGSKYFFSRRLALTPVRYFVVSVFCKVVLNPTCTGSRAPEWYKMQTSRNCPDDLRIQLTIRMDKPSNLKYCGYCYAVGRNAFKKWRKRYICLIQASDVLLPLLRVV
ncbi:unnamed protein product [Hydatigera taeniaeformis]|uniref:PH domain-containing protein n=1 Tax=Hydatigena taeniaeformis TaxID=6205 RepID=A0A0R3WX83_HYDTA|nr:unnamed protein product [Hydatigera taeniaeformis]